LGNDTSVVDYEAPYDASVEPLTYTD